jgi:Ca2+-binding EF-hand superfamily protein
MIGRPMTKTLSVACVLACFAVVPAIAQHPALPDRPIARSEVVDAIKQQFAAMDTNHDGVVTRDEFDAYRASQAPDRDGLFEHVGGHWFDKADARGDGRVTLSEAEERPLKLFDRADSNHDGIVDRHEEKTAMMMMKLSGK